MQYGTAVNNNEFKQHARHAFRFLIDDYDFEEENVPKKDLAAQPFQIRFANGTTQLTVEGIHHGFAIDIRLASCDPDLMQESTYCFDDLLSIRAPGLDLRVHEPHDSLDMQEVQLKRYANAVSQHAADVLGGDFSVFPELAAAIQQRRERFDRERGL